MKYFLFIPLFTLCFTSMNGQKKAGEMHGDTIRVYISSKLPATITGKVVDETTGEELKGAKIYYNKTTLVTETDENGKFVMDRVNTTAFLVISHKGFETKKFGVNSIKKDMGEIALKKLTGLDPKYRDTGDLSRKEKLEDLSKLLFGYNNNVSILNKKSIDIIYDAHKKMLVAYSKEPLQIKNPKLDYIIYYELNSVEVEYIDEADSKSGMIERIVSIAGNYYYKNTKSKVAKRFKKRRAKVYQGSKRHFMKALKNNQLEQEGFTLIRDLKELSTADVFKFNDNYGFTDVSLNYDKVEVKHDNFKDRVLAIKKENKITIDDFGHYEEFYNINFIGTNVNREFQDLVPVNYNLE